MNASKQRHDETALQSSFMHGNMNVKTVILFLTSPTYDENIFELP
jgi:hypothetical protein